MELCNGRKHSCKVPNKIILSYQVVYRNLLYIIEFGVRKHIALTLILYFTAHTCAECNAVLSPAFNLKRHWMIHFGERPYKWHAGFTTDLTIIHATSW